MPVAVVVIMGRVVTMLILEDWAGGGGSGGSGTAGTPNTGSGGGAKWNSPAGAGGSGICIIAVPVYRLAA